MKQTKSCGVIIFRENPLEYLLVEQSFSKLWNFPKGHMNNNETEHETALREVFEETGLKVKILEGFREIISYNESKIAHKTVVMFIGKPLSDKVIIPHDEISNFAWLNYKDAINKIKFDNSREMLQKADKFISNLRLCHLFFHKD
jgi:tRNA nucleotidyltransferase (CCA-adding enzyme)